MIQRRTLLAAGLVGLVTAPVAASQAGADLPADPTVDPAVDPAVDRSSDPVAGRAVEAGPARALDRLLAGNRRFVAGHARHPHQSLRRLRELAAGQHPFAVTLGCADSRVPPELLFDQGLGDLFDNRVAGNIVDDLILGSVEFAVAEFDTPVVLVLGHERCGAVQATVDAIRDGGTPPGHIGAIVDALRPIVEPLMGAPGDPVENGVTANARAQAAALVRRSDIVRERVAAGRLLVAGARYDLDTGRVTVLR